MGRVRIQTEGLSPVEAKRMFPVPDTLEDRIRCMYHGFDLDAAIRAGWRLEHGNTYVLTRELKE